MWSFAGAGIGALIVFGIGLFSKGGLTPVKLALAGTAVGYFLTGLSSAIAIRFDVAQDVKFWYAGGVASVKWEGVHAVGGRGYRTFAGISDCALSDGAELG